MHINPEQLAYWYLRLNGFLTIQNFIVHPDSGGNQRTDADVLGVRLPYRAELRPNPMIDEACFTQINDKPYIVLAEVKTGRCSLNGPWKQPERENLQRVLRALGAFPENEIEDVAKSIYTSGVFSNSAYHLTLACFGKEVSPEIAQDFPTVPQILWEQVLYFIYQRFRAYRDQKVSHGQWDEVGKKLWNCVWDRKNRDFENFKATVIVSDVRV